MQGHAMHVKAHMRENAMQCIGKCRYRGMQCNAEENEYAKACNVMHSKIHMHEQCNAMHSKSI